VPGVILPTQLKFVATSFGADVPLRRVGRAGACVEPSGGKLQ